MSVGTSCDEKASSSRHCFTPRTNLASMVPLPLPLDARIVLLDRLLRKEKLDLKLIPYVVLATGPLQGMAQLIPSKSIAAVVSENGTLLNYPQANYPDEGSVGTFSVEPGVIDTFVRSCGA